MLDRDQADYEKKLFSALRAEYTAQLELLTRIRQRLCASRIFVPLTEELRLAVQSTARVRERFFACA